MDPFDTAALRLHESLAAHHWDGETLTGPDPGIRFNYRVGRFVKSMLPQINWGDRYYYLQAQGYWILANWRLYRLTGEERYRQIAIQCSDAMIARQRPDGGWDYPNPEWKGRTATAEGTWGAIGLLETFRASGEQRYLNSAGRWYAYMVDEVGFQQIGDELAVNYFAGRGSARVPNNSAFALRFLAELAGLRKDRSYLSYADGLLAFLQRAQKPSGEFPYSLGLSAADPGRPHFQCYQYNAFECLDLIRYYELTGDERVVSTIGKVVDFLVGGVADDGHLHYDCGNTHREVTYHAAAAAAAFWKAAQVGFSACRDLAERGYAYVLSRQLPDGRYSYSRQDYRVLSDQRSYPRYLAMILYHLLLRVSDPFEDETTGRYGMTEQRKCA